MNKPEHTPLPEPHSKLPWAFDNEHNPAYIFPSAKELHFGDRLFPVTLSISNRNRKESLQDAAFILEACNNYHRLVAENKALREALQKCTNQLQGHNNLGARLGGDYDAIAQANNALKEDKDRLDWIQGKMTPADNYCEIFFAGLRDGLSDADAFQIECNPEVFPTTNAKTLREAIDKVRNLPPLEDKEQKG